MSEAVSNANWQNEIIGTEADEMLMVDAWKRHDAYKSYRSSEQRKLKVAAHMGRILPCSVKFEVQGIEVSRTVATV